MVLRALDELNAAAARFADMTGYTGHFTAYLGDRRGNVISDTAERRVYFHTDQMQTIGEAVLSEGCGITLQSAPRLIGIGIRLAYPPGQARNIGTPAVLGFSREGRYATGGATVIEQQLNNATFPNTNQIGPLRVTPTNPASTSVVISGPFVYRNITGAYRVKRETTSDLAASAIAALTSGQHQIGIIALDVSTESFVLLTNTASSAAGTLPARGEFTVNDILSITIAPQRMPILALYLYYGQADSGVTGDDCYYAWDLRPFMAVNPALVTTTEGDLVVRGASLEQRLAIGSNNQVLTVDTGVSGKMKWATPSSSVTTTEGDIIVRGGAADQRLAIGSNGQVLTVDTGVSGKLKYAAGATVVTTTEGDIIVRGGAADQRLAIGSNGQILTVNTAVSGKVEWAANAGGYVDSALMEGRLTLTTGSPEVLTDQTAQTTLYYTPTTGRGARVTLYESSAWVQYTLTEISITNSGLANSTNYDVFIYTSGGSRVLELTAWTNDTTRATALTTQDGRYVKSGATNKRYIGTIRTSSAGKFEDTVARRYVWNYHHRALRHQYLHEATSHTYNSTTVRYWNNSSANIVELVIGVADAYVIGDTTARVNGSNGLHAAFTGFNINVNNAYADTSLMPKLSPTTSTTVIVYAPNVHYYPLVPVAGYNYIAALESAGGATAPTYQYITLKTWVLC